MMTVNVSYAIVKTERKSVRLGQHDSTAEGIEAHAFDAHMSECDDVILGLWYTNTHKRARTHNYAPVSIQQRN